MQDTQEHNKLQGLFVTAWLLKPTMGLIRWSLLSEAALLFLQNVRLTPKFDAANLSEAETLLEDWVVWA